MSVFEKENKQNTKINNLQASLEEMKKKEEDSKKRTKYLWGVVRKWY